MPFRRLSVGSRDIDHVFGSLILKARLPHLILNESPPPHTGHASTQVVVVQVAVRSHVEATQLSDVLRKEGDFRLHDWPRSFIVEASLSMVHSCYRSRSRHESRHYDPRKWHAESRCQTTLLISASRYNAVARLHTTDQSQFDCLVQALGDNYFFHDCLE